MEAFDTHANALFKHASFRVSDRERAEDLVQETFVKVWLYTEKGKVIDEFRPFLYRTLNNLIIDEYRRKKHESLEEVLDEEWKEGREESLIYDELDALADHLDGAVLLEEVKRMPETYRTVFIMRFVDGLEPKEIAEATGETTNIVSVHIHRGLAWLRKELTQKEARGMAVGMVRNRNTL